MGGGVAFLRGVYRVRMRGVLRSFAYILKRRTATAPNMLARQEKKRKRGRGNEKERKGGEKAKGNKNIRISLLPNRRGRGGKEKRTGKRGTREIRRRSECRNVLCIKIPLPFEFSKRNFVRPGARSPPRRSLQFTRDTLNLAYN